MNEATSREPAGHRSARTAAGTDDEPVPGPLGDRCHGPSPCLGCCAYSSWMTSSLPGPASTLAPVRLSVTLTVPPRAGSAVTRYRPFSMTCGAPVTSRHAAAAAVAPSSAGHHLVGPVSEGAARHGPGR